MTYTPPEGSREERITAEIGRHRSAMVKHQRTIDTMPAYPGECCPSCKYGAAYTKPAERMKRCGENLARLLRKRGMTSDNEEAEAIEMGAWP